VESRTAKHGEKQDALENGKQSLLAFQEIYHPKVVRLMCGWKAHSPIVPEGLQTSIASRTGSYNSCVMRTRHA
jgi:hypothetical protein